MAEKKPPFDVTFDGKTLVLTVYDPAEIREDEEKEVVAYAPVSDDEPWVIEVLFDKSIKMSTVTIKGPATKPSKKPSKKR
jgi:hypothetical protein